MKTLNDVVIYSQGFCCQWNDSGWYMLLWERESRGLGLSSKSLDQLVSCDVGLGRKKCLL